MVATLKAVGDFVVVTGASMDVPIPAVAAGDYGTMWLYQATSETVPTVPGWTLALSEPDGAGGVGLLLWRVAPADAVATTVPVAVTAGGAAAKVVTFTDAGTTAPVVTTLQGANTTLVSPPLTVAEPTGLVFFAFLYGARTAGVVSTSGTISAIATARAWDDALGAYTHSTVTAEVASASGGTINRAFTDGATNAPVDTWRWVALIPAGSSPTIPAMPGETSRSTGTTGTTPWTRIMATVGGDQVMAYIPTDGSTPTTVVSMMHGAGPDETWPDDEPAPTRDFAIDQGWIVLGANAGGVSYASPTALNAWDAAHDWLETVWALDDVILYAGSMGSQLATIYAAQERHPGIRGLVLVDSLLSLQWYWDNAPPEWRDAIKAAYGFTNDADFATATAGSDPMTLPDATWDGMRLFISYSNADSTILPAQNSIPFLERLDGAEEVEVHIGTGEHSAPANFAPAQVNPWMLTLWTEIRTAAGDVALGGSATRTIRVSRTAVGSMALGGSATRTIRVSRTAVGSMALGGSAAAAARVIRSAAAGVALSGDAPRVARVSRSATEGVSLSGSASAAARISRTAAAQLSLSGVGDIAGGVVERTAVGPLGLSGSAVAVTRVRRTATGRLGLGGSATTGGTVVRVAVGRITLEGSVVVTSRVARTTEGRLALSGVGATAGVPDCPPTLLLVGARSAITLVSRQRTMTLEDAC